MQWLVNALSLISPLKSVPYAALPLLGARNGQPVGMMSNTVPNAAAVTKKAPLKIRLQAKLSLSLNIGSNALNNIAALEKRFYTNGSLLERVTPHHA
jgi:hypothetical protein